MSRLAIFDLDGTLIDSKEDLALAVNYALAHAGAPTRSLDEVTHFVGDGPAKLIKRSVEPRQELFDPVLETWAAYYAEHLLDHTVLYPGLAEVLAAARRPLAVQTNKPGDLARKILRGLGVLDRFAVVRGSDEGPRKPDPAGALQIAAQLGARPDEAVFVGDSKVDLETARAAGMEFVAVSWGYVPEQELAAAGAKIFVRSAAELGPWLGA
jgi:phosphoglycolate phosphatase